ncbi:hypothetical protein RYX41_09190 [Lactiplantibacillus plantarum]|nr:hypothetical protein [Lactiplantibacillus plantarum]
MFTDYVLLLFSTTPRRAKGLFNVLRGRRTVSTLFAGLTAGYLDLLDSCHEVPLEDFMAATAALTENGQLTSTATGCWQLTQAGNIGKPNSDRLYTCPKILKCFKPLMSADLESSVS